MCRFPTLELSRSGSKGVISGVLQPPRMLSYVLNYREQEIISQEPISKRFVKSHFLTTELTEHREYLILLSIYLCDLRGLCGKFDFLSDHQDRLQKKGVYGRKSMRNIALSKTPPLPWESPFLVSERP